MRIKVFERGEYEVEIFFSGEISNESGVVNSIEESEEKQTNE